MTSWSRVHDEVLYTCQDPTFVSAADIAAFKEMAKSNRRQRIRLCTHPDPKAPLHEMLIVMGRDSYVKPHRHLDKAESLHVIEGEATAIFFTDGGDIEQRVKLGPYGSGRHFYYRIDQSRFHTLLIETEWLVFAEATLGPFDTTRSVFAPWAPDETDPAAVTAYRRTLTGSLNP